jgi:hypothetical protein
MRLATGFCHTNENTPPIEEVTSLVYRGEEGLRPVSLPNVCLMVDNICNA